MQNAHKVVICGAGFLGSSIARVLAKSAELNRCIQISSRNPSRIHSSLIPLVSREKLLPPVPLDVTKPETLAPAFEGANVVISLVGILHGTTQQFEDIQWKGAENVANAAKNAGAQLIHFSAIGANENSNIPYFRTKGLAEKSVFRTIPSATIIRPSVVFGPEDDFFNRFSKLSKYLPCLPVFGGGTSKFQPVYVDDLARAVEIITRNDPEIQKLASGKIIEAGGPEVFTYRELMRLVLKYNGRYRPIISLPVQLGLFQASILEKLPPSLFTVTRSQIEQLQMDNVVRSGDPNSVSFKDLLEKYSGPLTPVRAILPGYL